MLGKTPASIEAIKPLQDGVIADIDSTTEMISYFIHKIYGNSLFKPEVMICVPIQVTGIERKALFDAVKGAKKTYIIEEGRAAINRFRSEYFQAGRKHGNRYRSEVLQMLQYFHLMKS